MCTVTVIPLTSGTGPRHTAARGFRLVTNRDESRKRPVALRPSIHRLPDDIRAAWPTDPAGGGTWVAASSGGIAMAAMNLNPNPKPILPPKDQLRSRGTLIPAMIDADSARAGMERLNDIDPGRFAPFRVVAVDPNEIVEVCWDRRDLTVRTLPLTACCFISSGLGDHMALPRLALFDTWISEYGVSPAAQDAFHRHRWSDRPEISVNMCREDARTVSTTSINIHATAAQPSVVMDYRDDEGQVRLAITPAHASGAIEPTACAAATREPEPC